MRFAAVSLIVFSGFVTAAPPPELAALQKLVHQVIDTAEPSVACILVSRSKEYAEFGEGPTSQSSGRLGGFNVSRHSRLADGPRRDLVRRLDLANPDTVPESYGSGIVIDANGLVLTNFHVIDRATKVFVRLPGQNRGSYADVMAADGRADLAVLKLIVPPVDLKALRLGDGAKIRKGDWVVALANPFAAGFRDGSPSASWGIVANLRRRAPGPSDEAKRVRPLSQYGTLLQTDARLNLGCSGGALLNLDGEVIALTTALAAIAGGETAGGYAIPIDANVKKMVEVLKRGEEIEYGFLGVTVGSDAKVDTGGVRITDVAAGMPAARAGLYVGDIVAAINGNPVREQDDLFVNIAAAMAGSDIEIDVVRGTRTTRVKARLTKSSAAGDIPPPIVSNRPKPVHGLRVEYGSTLATGSNPPEGVLIRELEPNSPAAKKLKDWLDKGPQLIITAVNGEPVPAPTDFYRVAAGKASVTLDIVELGNEASRKKVTLP
ncbi:MAG TPA: trypsin-like peptidase domain-containing protein [Gemmataceae bacterium]|jgi:serine protease Do|nr:trypsin-like peptidase domain-containing protein [Gemmataceae bacterium]